MFEHIQFVMNAKLIIHRELNIFEGRRRRRRRILMWEDERPCIFTFIWNILIVVLMLNLQAIGWVYIKFKKLIAEGFFNNANSQLRNLATPNKKKLKIKIKATAGECSVVAVAIATVEV
jgi:hypothetical protein